MELQVLYKNSSMLCCWLPPPLQLVPMTRIEFILPAARGETNKREENAEEKRRQKRREGRREEKTEEKRR